MTTQLQDANPANTLSLREQLIQKRQEQEKNREVSDAVQEPETEKVHVRKTAGNSEQVGGGSEKREQADSEQEEGEEETSEIERLRFLKGEKVFDVDEDAEIEIKADGKMRKMTLKELKDYAAGGVAVRNRMRQIAEEKKRLQEPFKKFSENSKKDAIGSLKKVFYAIKEVDPNADFKVFLKDLGIQAQKQAKMSPSELRSIELERDLSEKEERLTKSEMAAKLQSLEQEVAKTYDLTPEQIAAYGAEILKNPDLASTVRNEEELFDRIGELADEVDRQKASLQALQSINSSIKARDPLVFELSEILKKNPDFDSDDLAEIAEQVLNGVERTKASQKLSKKQRSKAIVRKDVSKPDFSKMKPVDVLKYKLLEKRKEQLNKR